MSTITGLFGGGGGGGAMTNIFTDPTYLMRSFLTSSQLRTILQNSTSTGDTSSSFWTEVAKANEWYTAILTAANTYVTVADISSAANGGFLYNVITNGCTGTFGDTSTIKITVDGTAYEFTGGQNGTSPTTNSRFCIGMMLGAYSIGTSDYENYDPFTTYWNYNWDVGDAVDTTNHVYGSSYRSMLPTASTAEGLNLQKVRFESSIKVEVKSTLYQSGNVYDQVLATIRLT